MNGVKKWFKEKSLRRSITNYLFLGVFMPFVLLGFLLSWLGTTEVEKILLQNTQQMLNQMDMMLGFYMQNVENTMYIIEHEPSVAAAIGGDDGATAQQAVRSFMSLLENRNPEIAGILLVLGDGSYISNGMYPRSRDSLTKEAWYIDALRKPDEYLLTSKPLGRNLTSVSKYSDDEIMSIVKAVRNTATGRCDGVLLLDFRLSAFDENIKNIILGSKGFLYVTDANGDIIYAPSNNVIYRIDNQSILKSKRESTMVRVGAEYYQVICKSSHNWNVLGVFLASDVMSAGNKLKATTMALFLISLVFVLVFSARLDKQLFKPLNDLQQLMHVAETRDIDVHYDVKTNDEIGALGNSFNQMISEIKKLLDLVEEEHKRKREAELRVLQEQIKPHFLYNTLEAINWMALDLGAMEIVRLVTALTNLFHISLSGGREMIEIRQEIEQVKNYLIIQNIRYEDAFRYEFHVDEEILDNVVLKLILQPLVENSLYHGIKEKGEPGMIRIAVYRQGSDVLLQVGDDGAGVPPETAAEINEMFSTGVRTLGYGLYNTNLRIRHSFGAGYGLLLESEEGIGTCVTIRHPLMGGNEDEIAHRG